MILEKQLYRRQFEEKWYSNFKNIIWAEDLFDIDVFVYQGKLNSIDGYRASMTEEYILIVVSHKLRKLKTMDVFADVDNNRLYVPKGNYKFLHKDILESMARYMESNYVLGKPGDHIQIVKQQQSASKPKQPHIVSEAERRKQSLLDNHAYSYFYEEDVRRFHDRSCSLLHDISGEKLSGLTEYPSDLPCCRRCRYAALVREGCSPHVRHISTVMHILQKASIPYDTLKEYVLELGMKFDAPTPDELYVSLKEDKWIIRMGTGKKHALWHNNYRMIDDKTRIMIGGFHDQDFSSTVKGILKYITMYDWSAIHVKPEQTENLADTATANAAVANAAVAETMQTASAAHTPKSSNLFSRIKQILLRLDDKIRKLITLH